MKVDENKENTPKNNNIVYSKNSIQFRNDNIVNLTRSRREFPIFNLIFSSLLEHVIYGKKFQNRDFQRKISCTF